MATKPVRAEPRDDVVFVTKREVDRAARRALRDLGLTLPELREQARAGRFTSERARLVWLAIGDLDSEG